MERQELLRTLLTAHGPSGDEGAVRDAIQKLVTPLADEVTVDVMGNLIAHRRGAGPKVLLAAHMDTVGVIVTHIEDSGYLRFGSLGGLEAKALYQTAVRFRNGVGGVISVDEEKAEQEFKLTDLYLDIGAADGAEARTMVSVGDTAVFCGPILENGTRVIAPYLDNRAGCAALIQVLEGLRHTPNDLFFVFTAQEEVGLRGAKPAAWALEPDYALIVDVTCPDDVPGATHDGTTAVGKGAAIKVMDHAVICHPAMVERLSALARKGNIPAQRDLLRTGGTDGGPVHVSREGVLTGGVSIPCRYTHTPAELMDWKDFDACVRLIQAFCEEELEQL